MKTFRYALKNEWYIFILLLIPFLVIPFIWHQLPAQMATHWDLHGKVNGTSSKATAIFLEPVLNLGIYFFLLYSPQFDPKKRLAADQKALPILRLSIVLFLFCSYAWSTLKALNYNVPDVNWMLPAIAVLFMVIGNYLRTVQPNYFIGIRAPWALEDPKNWRQTHRMASWLWVGGGLLLLILFPFFSSETYFTLFMIVSITLAVMPIGYSFYLYKFKS